MKKVLWMAALALAVLVVGVVGYFWYASQQPLYQPGLVRAGRNLRAPLAPPAQSGDEQFWAVEADIRLYHFAHGAGRNALIVHGGPGFPYTQPWAGLEPLAAAYAFQYYDQRGCGQSSRPIDRFASANYYQNVQTLDQALGLGAQIADLERIRQILGEEKLILIGHSFGGFLASLYAAEFPERVEALVLVAPADVLVMPPPSGGLFPAVRERLPETMRAEFDAYLEEYLNYRDIFAKSEADLAALNADFGQFYVAALENSALDTPLPSQGEAGGWMVHAMYFSMGLRHDYRGALAQVPAPVLVLHGADDLQPESVGQMYVEAFPAARLAVIPDAGHFMFEEQPEAFAAAVSEFLRAPRAVSP